jgi:DNA integrity scanning protein DisA with diadenylate cyclase activity
LADPSERCKEAGYRHRCSRRVAIMLSYLPIEISNIGARF